MKGRKRSAQKGRKRHQERDGPQRRLLSIQPGDERRRMWEVNPRTCRRIATPRPPPRARGTQRKRVPEGEGGEIARRMLKVRLGPRVCSKASTHLTPRRRARSLAPFFWSPSRRRDLPPLFPPSPPLTAPAADLSAPLPAPLPPLAAFRAACTVLFFFDQDGGGGKAVSNSSRLPPPGRREGVGVLRFTSSSGSRELLWRSGVVRLGLTSLPFSSPFLPCLCLSLWFLTGTPPPHVRANLGAWESEGSTTEDRARLLPELLKPAGSSGRCSHQRAKSTFLLDR